MRKLLLIASIILLSTITSQAQTTRMSPSQDGTERVIKMYPIPATAFITFEFQKQVEKGATVLIHSLAGKKMYESKNLGGKLTIDLGEFIRGIYFYQLVDPGGKLIESGKFQVSK
ncbi:MAG: T9SS type A sorting domain-containing protein [Chitinophagaceae bacterium]|nr:T9SS type A sorting domain-containing protein [Chitinophagaceae bacterium]